MSNKLALRGVIVSLAIAVGSLAGGSCTPRKDLRPVERPGGSSRCDFRDVAREAGVVFRHTWGAPKMRNIIDSVGSGVGFFDYNNDGHMDIYLLQGANLSSKLFRNNGDGTFTDVTDRAGVQNFGIGLGLGAADYDNDGHMDLFVTNFGPGKMYRNDGDGTFTDVTKEAGLEGAEGFVAHVAFADIDNNGFLDLLVIRYIEYDENRKVHPGALSKREGFHFFAGPLDYEPVEMSLFKNNGDGTFTDTTEQAGITKKGKGCAVAFCDFDGDGYQDFLIANDRFPKHLYRNNRDGTFTEIGVEAGVAYDEKGDATGGMAVGVDDFSGNLKFDAVITTMLFEQNPLFKNLGDFKFKDVARQSGFAQESYRAVAFGLATMDIDNDTWRDIVITNGHVVDYIDAYSQTITSRQPRHIYWNKGYGEFEYITPECGDLNTRKLGRGMAYGDFDNDGRMDLVTNDAGEFASLYRNVTESGNNWLRIQPVGVRSNRGGIGAKVYVMPSVGRTQVQEVRAESGYMATNDPRPLFGLGKASTVDRVEIHWPGGMIDVVETLGVNQTLEVTEGSSPGTSTVPK